MSGTNCRSCQEPITFVLRADGRWRPVDMEYTVLELEGDEMACLQAEGSWQVTNVRELRVYKSHACPENPAWNQGRARTKVITPGVNTDTGEVEPDEDEDPEQTDSEWRAEAQAKDRANALRKMSQAMQYVLLHGCPECGAPEAEPCQSTGGWPIPTVCKRRKLMAAFGEGQQWPPRHNQIGFVQMKSWLSANAGVFQLNPTTYVPATPTKELDHGLSQ